MNVRFKTAAFALAILGALLSGQSAYAATEAPARGARELASDIAIAPQAMYEDVLANYSSYTCPNGYSSHKISKFDLAYKRISFKTSYREVNPVLVGEWKANMCGCTSLGTVRRYQCRYSTW